MGLCDRCARLLHDLKTFARTKAASFVQSVKTVMKRLSGCCFAKRDSVFKDKMHELLRQNDAETAHARAAHLDAVQNHVSTAFLETCCALLQSEDLEVQKTVTCSLVKLLAVNKINEDHVTEMGFLQTLIDLLQSGDHMLQCNSSACIALLASSESNREAIVEHNGVLPLLVLTRSFDPKIQQNAVRALFNLTKSESTMNALCEQGAIPVLVLLLQSADSEVQFYSCSALSNIAPAPKHHTKLLQIGDCFLLKCLVSLMGSSVVKNSIQACQCLRSLIVNGEAQQQLFGLNYMSPLLTLLRSQELSCTEAALVLLAEISAHPRNGELLLNVDVMHVLGELLRTHQSHPSVVITCAKIVTHLCDLPECEQPVLESECMSGLLLALGLDWNEPEPLLSAISCLNSLACYDSLRTCLVKMMTDVHVTKLVRISCETDNSELSFAAGSVINKLDMNDKLVKSHQTSIVRYLVKFLRSQEVRFQQLAIASVCNLKSGGSLRGGMLFGSELEQELNRVQQQTEHTNQLLKMLQ